VAKRHRKDELKLNPKLSNEKTNDFLGMAVRGVVHNSRPREIERERERERRDRDSGERERGRGRMTSI